MSENERMKQDFLSGKSYNMIAKEYNKSEAEVKKIGRSESWYKIRKKEKEKKTNEQMLQESTERLCKCLERAISEIDSYVTTVKKKEKSLEYDDEGKKVVNETIYESEELKIAKGVVDRGALKQLIAALSALKGEECIYDEENGMVVVMSEEAKDFAK